MTSDELQDMVAKFAKSLPADIAKDARRIAKQKRQQERMLPFFNTVSELVNTHKLLPSDSDDVRIEAYFRLVEHAENLWEDSVNLLRNGSYSSSVFFSIVTVEELGKLAVAKVQAVMGVPTSCKVPGAGKGKSKLRSHVQKHLMAACAGAVINSRLDRKIGMDRVLAFIEQVEKGELELERQNCLYYDFNGKQHIPRLVFDKERAALLCVIAGELLAEVGSVELTEFERLLAKVEVFETELTKHVPGIIKDEVE